jgi:hypothetical protein
MDIDQSQSPWMEVPLHTLMKLTPKAYGTVVEKYKADIPAVSTWRPQGSTAKHHDSITEGPALELPGDFKNGTATPKQETTVVKEREVEIQKVVAGASIEALGK